MKVTLTANEMARAIAVYMGAKLSVPPEALTVRIRWRGEYAEVEQVKVPTLTDEVTGSER
jgi:hypothetical protein